MTEERAGEGTRRRGAALANLVGTGSATAVAAVQALVLIPLYLHYLGARLYGAWLGSGDILNVLQLLDLGLTNVLTQRIGAAHGRGDSEQVGHYFAASLVIMTGLGMVMATAGVVVAHWLPGWMKLEGSEATLLASCVRGAAVPTLLVMMQFGILALARGMQETWLVNAGTVAGSLAGFVTTLLALTHGAGLWSIVYGMIVRSAIWLGVAAWFAAGALRRGLSRSLRLKKAVLRDVFALSPATALAGLGQVLTSQTEAAMVSIALKPELAPVLTLTRRAIDVAAGLLNALSYSAYAGYAHLVASNDRQRAMQVHAEVSSLFVTLALAAAAAYVAVNSSLVTVWAGYQFFGGLVLTVLMATQMIIVGRSQLQYYLYRATGAIQRGSWLQLIETLIRLPIMLGLLLTIGLPGLAVAGIVTASAGSWLAMRWTRAALSGFAHPAEPLGRRLVVVRVGVAAAGIALGAWAYMPRWGYVLAVGGALASVAALAQLRSDPTGTTVRRQIARWLPRRVAQLALGAS